jgi:hypothetical protein
MRFVAGLACTSVLAGCSGTAPPFLGGGSEGGPDADSPAAALDVAPDVGPVLDPTIGAGAQGDAATTATDAGGAAETDPRGATATDAGDAGGATETDSRNATETDSRDATVPDRSTREVVDASDGDVVDEPTRPTCILGNDLSNSGIGPFEIAFTITTTTAQYVALLNQRFQCNAMYQGFWDLRYRANTETIEFELNDKNGHNVSGEAGARLNDNAAHRIVFSRTAGTWTIKVDDVVTGTGDAGAMLGNLAFGSIAALKIGADICIGEDNSGINRLDVGMIPANSVCLSQ